LEFLANEVGQVPGFETASPEQVLKAIASRLTELSTAVEKARKQSGTAAGSTEQPTVDVGASAGDVPAGGNNRASTCGDKVAENISFLTSLLSQQRNFRGTRGGSVWGGSGERPSTLILL
jgi:hypothetical protein